MSVYKITKALLSESSYARMRLRNKWDFEGRPNWFRGGGKTSEYKLKRDSDRLARHVRKYGEESDLRLFEVLERRMDYVKGHFPRTLKNVRGYGHDYILGSAGKVDKRKL